MNHAFILIETLSYENAFHICDRSYHFFKRRQNQKLPLFQREEDELFTFHLMVNGELKVKQW